jgi:hypothetical protein
VPNQTRECSEICWKRQLWRDLTASLKASGSLDKHLDFEHISKPAPWSLWSLSNLNKPSRKLGLVKKDFLWKSPWMCPVAFSQGSQPIRASHLKSRDRRSLRQNVPIMFNSLSFFFSFLSFLHMVGSPTPYWTSRITS